MHGSPRWQSANPAGAGSRDSWRPTRVCMKGLQMPSRERRPILVCNVGWMDRYEGNHDQPDTIEGGGQWVTENDHGHECCNFLPDRTGLVFGHFETIKGEKDRKVNLDRLGASATAAKLKHVDVVWVATHPEERGRRVVGYYLDATVYRKRQEHIKRPTAQHQADGIKSYMVTARAENAVLLPLEERNVRLKKGPGWIGHTNWWYPEASTEPDVPAFLKKVRELLEGRSRSTAGRRKGSGKWGGPTDPERSARVEEAAVAFVEAHFNNFTVESVEKENRGWDLELYARGGTRRKGRPDLIVEVKGLSSNFLQIGVTPNEFDALRNHVAGDLPHYRLCVVTGALSAKPTLHVFHYAGTQLGWMDERAGSSVSLNVQEKTAAIICLND